MEEFYDYWISLRNGVWDEAVELFPSKYLEVILCVLFPYAINLTINERVLARGSSIYPPL